VTDQANTKAAGRRATETVEATADPRATAIEASPISSPDPRLRRHRPPLRRDRSGWAIPKNLARSTEVTAIGDGRWSIIQLRVTTGEWSRIPCRAGPSVFVRLAVRPRQVSGGVFGGLGDVDVVVDRPRLELGDRQHRSTYSRRRWRGSGSNHRLRCCQSRCCNLRRPVRPRSCCETGRPRRYAPWDQPTGQPPTPAPRAQNPHATRRYG